MPSGRTADDFTIETSPTGESVDKEMQLGEDNGKNLDLTNPFVLNGIYHLLDQGEKLNTAKHADIIAKLVEYEQESSVPVEAIKNFAVSTTNQVIESPTNYLYLSNGVSTATIKQFSSRSDKAATANEGRKENPAAQARQKYENMIGKMGIGIMASQMKVLSAHQYTTNSTLKKISDLYDKQLRYEEIFQNYNYHLDAIHDPEKHYIGTHTKEELEKASEIVAKRIGDLKETIKQLAYNITDKHNDLSLPNINYSLLSERFQQKHTDFTLHRTSNNLLVDDSKKLSWTKLASTFDPDSADFFSQFLSSATDNAKELDLGKLNATPDVMTIYPSMGLVNKSFEEMVDKMNSPLVDMLLRNSTKNVYDKETSDNNINTLLTNVKLATTDKESASKSQAIDDLFNKYKLQYTNGGFIDTNTRDFYSNDDLLNFRDYVLKPAQAATLLSGYLSINQGIKTNNWDLYGFANRLQDNINAIYTQGSYSNTSFNFKQFLDSLNNNSSYHKTVIKDVTSLIKSFANINFNPLYVLASNEHYAKQLSAFNSANTILRNSSYRVNSMYHFVNKLRDMGYIGSTSNIKQNDFQEVEKFVEANIINAFIKSETDHNSRNNDEKPIFKIGDQQVYLTTKEGRKQFMNWMQTDFLTDIRLNSALKGNAFMQDLRLDSKQDPLSFDKEDFMKLQMDTTNVKTNTEQGPFRDAYVAGLKEVYDRKYTDLNGNNLFNSLFWYNLILNKNNITKNSYAKLLGDVMWQDNMDPNVYSRLFELKGKVGKSSKVELNLGYQPDNDNFYKMSIAGIPFDLRNLIKYYEVGNTERLPPMNPNDLSLEFNDEGNFDVDSYDQDVSEGSDSSDVSGHEDTDFTMGDAFVDDGDEATKTPRNYMSIDRTKQMNVPGTIVTLRVNKEATTTPITDSTTFMPLDNQNINISSEIGYNPFDKKPVELRPDQNEAFNYYKLAIGNIHDLLSRLSDATEVQITHNGVQEKFDKNKNYDC